MKLLCKSCCHWVDCGLKDNKPYGFCLCRDLFSYTAKTEDEHCIDYNKGTPLTEKEYEDWQ